MWKKNDDIDNLIGINEDVTLVQLMDSLWNVNHAISVLGFWILDSNYKKEICLTQESLDIKCSTPIGEELVAMFKCVFYSVRYTWVLGNLKEEWTWHCQVSD